MKLKLHCFITSDHRRHCGVLSQNGTAFVCFYRAACIACNAV